MPTTCGSPSTRRARRWSPTRPAGKLKHVLAWDAVNAIAPTHARAQVAFKLDYAGGWGKSHTNAWKTFGDALRRLRRPAARLEGRRVQGAGRLLLGAAGLAADAAELRRRPERPAGGLGASPLALDRRPAGADDRHRLGLAPVGSPLRDVHLRRPARLRLQVDVGRQPARLVRPQHLRRHVRLGLRHRAGSARTASWRTAAPESSVTASTRTGRIRQARASSTARRSKARASRPT